MQRTANRFLVVMAFLLGVTCIACFVVGIAVYGTDERNKHVAIEHNPEQVLADGLNEAIRTFNILESEKVRQDDFGLWYRSKTEVMNQKSTVYTEDGIVLGTVSYTIRDMRTENYYTQKADAAKAPMSDSFQTEASLHYRWDGKWIFLRGSETSQDPRNNPDLGVYFPSIVHHHHSDPLEIDK